MPRKCSALVALSLYAAALLVATQLLDVVTRSTDRQAVSAFHLSLELGIGAFSGRITLGGDAR